MTKLAQAHIDDTIKMLHVKIGRRTI